MEDHSENRMKESVNLFRVLVSEPWFRYVYLEFLSLSLFSVSLCLDGLLFLPIRNMNKNDCKAFVSELSGVSILISEFCPFNPKSIFFWGGG